MARILYGVAGQGYGHAIRAKIIGDFLIKEGHKVFFETHCQGVDYLKKYFPIIEIPGMHLRYVNNVLNVPLTSLEFVLSQPLYEWNVRKLKKIIKDKEIDLVITDFEHLVARAGERSKVPILSIDNMHALIKMKMSPGQFSWWPVFLFNIATNFFARIKATEYFISSFFPVICADTNVRIFAPIVRPEILATPVVNGEHILVYSTSHDLGLLDKMKSLPKIYNFVVYGFNRNEEIAPNILLKKTDNQKFIEDLASAQAVISTAGSNLVTEAIYFKKPILALPIKNQLEQMANAYYVEKLGFGLSAPEFNSVVMKKFQENYSTYKNNLLACPEPDNRELFAAISDFINRYA